MANGKKLDELHVNQLGTGPQRQGVPLAPHIRGCTVTRVEFGQASGSQNHSLGLKRNGFAVAQADTCRPRRASVRGENLDDGYVADPADCTDLPDLPSQRGCHGRAGVEKIDVAAATAAMAGSHFLLDMAVLSRPARAPPLHFEDTLGPFLAEKRGQLFVAKTASGFHGVGKMDRPVVRLLVADGCGDGHLRHDRRATATHKTLVEKNHRRAASRRRNCGVHPGASGAYDQHIRGEVGHHSSLALRIADCRLSFPSET